MKPAISVTFALLVTVLLVGCRSPYYADKGAALGGVAGGLAGAALGDQSGHAAGGALMGSAVGALTGAAIGDSMDAEVDRSPGDGANSAAIGKCSIDHGRNCHVRLWTGGRCDHQSHSCQWGARSLTPGEIIELHENGVSERVIDAMQQEAARMTVPPTVVGGRPVIIEESYIVPPYCGPRPYRHYHYPTRAHRRPQGVTWGFSYSR